MAFLTLMSGDDRGRVDLIVGDITVGRSPKCAIQYTDQTVSRMHARIYRQRDAYYIEDLDSQHGTIVDGKRIDRPVALQQGALIELGACNLVFDGGMAPAARPTSMDGQDSNESSSGTAVLDAVATIESHRQSNDTKLRAVLEIMHNVGVALDVETIFPKILESILTLFPNAERACIQLVDGQGPLRLAAAQGRGGAEPEFPLSQSLIELVLSGQAVVSGDATIDPRLSRDSVYNLGLKSLMCAPLVNEGELAGLIYIDTKNSVRPFQAEDLHVLITIANLAARGLGRAKLHAARIAYEKQEQDLKAARDLQLHFLPREAPRVANYDLATYYKAAFNVGGDYLGCLPMDDGRVALIVADVAGKGMSAALVMSRFCSDIRYGLAKHSQAKDVVQWLSDQMAEEDEYGRFITMALGILDPQTHEVQIANAGHPPPLLRTASGVSRWDVALSGPPLGVLPETVYRQDTWTLAPGDCLLMHSDGANEAEAKDGKQFGLKRVADTLRNSSAAAEAVEDLRQAVAQYMTAESQPDDLCILAVSRHPDSESDAA